MTRTDLNTRSIMKSDSQRKWVNLDAIQLWERNPNQGDIGAIIQMIRRFGYRRPIGLWQDNITKSGNHRTIALRQLRQSGWTPTEKSTCLYVDNDGNWFVEYIDDSDLEAQESDAFGIADNRSTRLGMDDPLALSEFLQELANDDPQLFEATGFDEDDLREMLNQAYPKTVEEVDAQTDRAEELNQKWQVERGDLWQIGEHRLLCGDSASQNDIAVLLGNETMDAVVTDPPYGMRLDASYQNSQGNFDRGIKKSSGYDNVIGDFEDFSPKFLFETFNNVKEQFWFGADYYHCSLPQSGSWIVWDKRAGLPDFDYTLSEFELCWSKTAHLRKIIRVRWFGAFGTETQDVKHRIHPTQKPVELISEIIDAWCGGFICDPFGGSGTTMVACEQLGRQCRMIEIEPKYCAVILERMASMGLEPERINNPM